MTEQIERLSQALVTDQSSTNTSLALDQSITSLPVHHQSIASQAPSYSQSMPGTLPTHYQSITEDNSEDEPDEILYDFLEPEPAEQPKVEPLIAPSKIELTTEGLPKLRQTKTTTPPAKVAEILKLRAEGVSLKEVSKRVGVAKSTVCDILKRAKGN